MLVKLFVKLFLPVPPTPFWTKTSKFGKIARAYRHDFIWLQMKSLVSERSECSCSGYLLNFMVSSSNG